ncbi:MAG TPA: hypothetical protein VNV86_03370, partial [Candidatus Acidoferrum sp.]|nr:hypothetical protein [Candidatus Acidoferrum sp.]
LEGRPVLARAATWRYRFGKWLRRHRVAIPAGAAAALLIAGFAGATWWEARRSERRFQQVRLLAGSVMYELHDAIRTLPGSTSARALLVRRAMQYLENLNREAGNRPDLQLDVAKGYIRVGEVEGFLGESNLGNMPGAAANFGKGEAILAGLVARFPHDQNLIREHQRASVFLVGAYTAAGRFPEALALSQRTAATADQMLTAHADDSGIVDDAIACLSNQADVLTTLQQYAQATPIRERVELLSTRLVALRPQSAEAARTLALSHKKLAALYGMANRYADARGRYLQAAAIDERRLAANPNDTRAKLDLSFDYGDLGWVAGRMGQFADSLAAYRRVYALRAEVAQADPNDQRALESLAGAGNRVGIALRRVGDFDGAEREQRRAIAMFEDMIKRGKFYWDTVRRLALAHDDLADTIEQRCASCKGRVLAELNVDWDLMQGLRAKGQLPKADDQYLKELAERREKLR